MAISPDGGMGGFIMGMGVEMAAGRGAGLYSVVWFGIGAVAHQQQIRVKP